MTAVVSRWALASVVLAATAIAGFGVTGAAAQEKIEKRFEKWTVTCVDSGSQKNCAITQAFSSAKTKGVVFSWSVVADGAARKAVIRTPTNVSLAEGVQLKAGADKPIRIAYKTCGPRFCFAEMPFGDDWLKYFQGGQTVPVTVSPMAGKPADITVDLKGFGDAYAYFQQQLAG